MFELKDDHFGILKAVIFQYDDDEYIAVTPYYDQNGVMMWVTGLTYVTNVTEVLTFCFKNGIPLVPESCVDLA